MRRVLFWFIISLAAPGFADAAPITDFVLFGGNQVTIGTHGNLGGQTGSNGTITVKTGSSIETLMGGAVLEQAQVDTQGNIVSSTTVTVGVGDHVTGNIDSGGDVIVRPGGIVGGRIRAAGTVYLDIGARVNGNIDAGQSSGTAVTVRTGAVALGTVTHKAGTIVSLAGGATPAVTGANIVGTPASPTPYIATVIPAATSFSSGFNSFTVPNGGFLSLLPSTSPATTYNDINVGSQATLHLVAGTYYFDTWNFDNNAKLDFDLSGGNIQLFFTGNVLFQAHLDVTGVGAADASRISAETLKDWNLTGEWFGTIFGSGPTSKIIIGPESALTGSAWARNSITTDQELIVTPLPAPPPAQVPEPSSLALLGTGLIALASWLRSRR